MRTKFKPWAEPYIKEHPEIQADNDFIINNKDIYLEIGSGKGLFLTTLATRYPNKTFVGIERNVTCCGFFAKKIVDNKLNNVKLYYVDAEKALSELPEDCLSYIYLNFSDPWPKKRHHKRRLTSERFIPLYQKVLKKGGVIVMKTDNEELFDYSKENFVNNGFIIEKEERIYSSIDEDDAYSEYELDFRKEGLPIYRMKVKYE